MELEGAEHPFLVWTDHKNLEYLRTANRLKSRQARWAMLFTRFHFTISYRPGSKNVKPDTRSRLYSLATTPSDPETILHTFCLAAAIIWVIESLVCKVQPDVCPGLCMCSGPGMGTFLDTHLSSWLPSDYGFRPTMFLVTHLSGS